MIDFWLIKRVLQCVWMGHHISFWWERPSLLLRFQSSKSRGQLSYFATSSKWTKFPLDQPCHKRSRRFLRSNFNTQDLSVCKSAVIEKNGKNRKKWECQSNLSAIVEPRKGAGSANQADLRSKILRKEKPNAHETCCCNSVTVTHLTKMQIAQICVAFCQSFAVTIWLGICFTSVDIPRKRIFTCYSEYSSWRPVLTPRFGNGLGHRLGMTKGLKSGSDTVLSPQCGSDAVTFPRSRPRRIRIRIHKVPMLLFETKWTF